MRSDFLFKDNYVFADLVEIMRILRGENGCPWDREQNHKSIRNDFIEETYEVIEAINKNDKELIEVIKTLTESKRVFDKYERAITDADKRGYGIVTPTGDGVKLEKPELFKQGNVLASWYYSYGN